MSLSTTLGLTPGGASSSTSTSTLTTPSYTSHYLTFHFLFAYAFLSTRPWKYFHKLDHQVSPRQDLTKYGPQAVQSGKITPAQLNRLLRIEACHANSMENFAPFAASMLFAHVAGVEHHVINRAGLAYTVARILYSIAYVFVADARLALSRGVLFWIGSIVCVRLMWQSGKVLNAKTMI